MEDLIFSQFLTKETGLQCHVATFAEEKAERSQKSYLKKENVQGVKSNVFSHLDSKDIARRNARQKDWLIYFLAITI